MREPGNGFNCEKLLQLTPTIISAPSNQSQYKMPFQGLW